MYTIKLIGNKFSPNMLSKHIKFNIKILAEYGKKSLKGPNKGKPTPYGLAIIENVTQSIINKLIN